MAYIALKPIRFNRFYAISEIIPEDVVDPKMAKRHIEWGNIAKVSEPVANDAGGEPSEPTGNAAGGDEKPDAESGDNSETANAETNNQSGEPPKKSGKK